MYATSRKKAGTIIGPLKVMLNCVIHLGHVRADCVEHVVVF